MKTTQYLIKMAIVVVVSLCSCTMTDDEPGMGNTVREEIPLSRSQKDIIDSESRFAFDLLKAVNEQAILDGNSNFVISPFSLSRNLSMLACGANDETLQSILNVLHLDNETSIDELNDFNRYIYNALVVADNKTELKVSNSFWYNKGFPVKQSFLELIGSNYDARSKQVDMSSPNTTSEINKWIKESTKGKIVDHFIPGEISGQTNFVLLDATYFKGTWRFSLDEKDTKEMIFFNKGVRGVKVPTMNRKEYMKAIIGGDENVTMLGLDYGNGAFSIYLIMADAGYDINDIIGEFDIDRWKSLKESSRKSNMKFSLPNSV